MIQQNWENEKIKIDFNKSFLGAIKSLQICRLLPKCGIKKDTRKQKGETSSEKRTAFEILKFLLLMVFQGCSLNRFLGSKKQDIASHKNTYNRFLSDCHYNWRKFITLLAVKVVEYFDSLTCETRFKALVIDDSVIKRGRSKKVELLAFIFDHVTNKTVRGFNLLTSLKTIVFF